MRQDIRRSGRSGPSSNPGPRCCSPWPMRGRSPSTRRLWPGCPPTTIEVYEMTLSRAGVAGGAAAAGWHFQCGPGRYSGVQDLQQEAVPPHPRPACGPGRLRQLLRWVMAPLLYAALLMLGFASWFYLPVLFTIPLELPEASEARVALTYGTMMTIASFFAFLSPLFVGTSTDILGTYNVGFVVLALLALTLLAGGIVLPETGAQAAESRRQERGVLDLPTLPSLRAPMTTGIQGRGNPLPLWLAGYSSMRAQRSNLVAERGIQLCVGLSSLTRPARVRRASRGGALILALCLPALSDGGLFH